MLNLVTFDPEYDSELIECSYDAIRNKEALEIIVNEEEKKLIRRKILAILTIPAKASFSFQNLFRMNFPEGTFYIAQCLLDFGYPVSHRLVQSLQREYHFRLVGFASMRKDLGNTVLRPETKIDRVTGLFWGNDIDISGADHFNDKYYLVSDNKEAVYEAFDRQFVNTLGKYDGLILFTKGKDMLISFEETLEEDQSTIAEDIFLHFKYLSVKE